MIFTFFFISFNMVLKYYKYKTPTHFKQICKKRKPSYLCDYQNYQGKTNFFKMEEEEEFNATVLCNRAQNRSP